MIRNFILNLSFVRGAINKAGMEGTDYGVEQTVSNYKSLYTANYLIDEKIEKAVNERLSKLLGVVDENFVITYNEKTGQVFMSNTILEEYQIMNLKAEAEAISQMQIWKTLSETLKQQAHKTIFEKSTEFQDVINGKMMLYNLSLQQKIIDIFRKYTPKPNPNSKK